MTPEDAAGTAVIGDELDGLGGSTLGADTGTPLDSTLSEDGEHREPAPGQQG